MFFWLNLPYFIVLAIPMSTLFAALITYGRLSSDSELIVSVAVGKYLPAGAACYYPQLYCHGHNICAQRASCTSSKLPGGSDSCAGAKARKASVPAAQHFFIPNTMKSSSRMGAR
jgi:hypothetical protein